MCAFLENPRAPACASYQSDCGWTGAAGSRRRAWQRQCMPSPPNVNIGMSGSWTSNPIERIFSLRTMLPFMDNPRSLPRATRLTPRFVDST